MNTFLPYADFQKSARCLDTNRLHNQINEALIIMRTLTGYYVERGKRGWPHHPATRLWRGHIKALGDYCLACLDEYSKRTGKEYHSRRRNICEAIDNSDHALPRWLGNEDFHSAHRAALLAKDFDWYSQFGWTEKPKIEYIWPE